MSVKEWFAVKRGKKSSYQFYSPHANNRRAIENLAPDAGNFEVIELIERKELQSAVEALKVVRRWCDGVIAPNKLKAVDKLIKKLDFNQKPGDKK